MPSSRVATILASLSDDEKQKLLRELQSHVAEPKAPVGSEAAATPFGISGIELRCLLELLPVVVVYFGSDQRCRYANKSFERWLGVSRERMANAALSELLGSLYELNRPYIEGALRGEPQSFERTVPDPQGGPSRHSLAHFIPDIQDGVVKGFVALISDVTDLHLLREELRERASEKASLFDLLPVGVSTLDAEGNVLTMNRALESILGLDAPSARRGDHRARAYVHPDGRWVLPEELPSARAIREQRPAGASEIGFRKEDGSMVWVAASAVPIPSRRSACLVVTRDITHERNMQSSLERSNQRFSAILEAMPVPIALNDEQGNITYLNRTFTELFGYTTDDVPNLDAWWPRAYPNATYRQRVATEWSARLERAKREGRPFEPVELDVVTKSGATRIVIGSAASLSGTFDGEHMVVLFDVTEKARAEGFLRSVLNSAMDAIITVDDEQCIVTFNSGAERIFRCAASTAIGGPLARFIPEDVRLRHADDVRAFGEQSSPARAMASSKTRSPLGRRRAVYGLRADGDQFPLEASISTVTIGERRYFTAICRDTTDLQRAEAAREQLEAQLRQLQKLETIGNFASGIAHDFNNILTTIMGLASVALSEHASNSALTNDLTAIMGAVKRGAQLARQLLSLSRPTSEEFRPVALDSVVREVSKLLRSALPRNIEIEETISRELPPVLADAGQVHQVLLNLCGNSAHAMRSGPGRLRLSLDSWRGSPGPGLPDREYVRMSVCDTGHGIPQDVLPQIFEPFFTTKKSGEGSGLGLAIVRAIVESHAGAITVESDLGVQTTFRVYWPALADSILPAAAGLQSTRKGTHVLFVDDDAAACRSGERILRSQGYQVTTFMDPEEAWVAFSASPTSFDVVVTDLSMPHMTGLQLAKKLLGMGHDLPIILCTGNPGTLSTPALLAVGIRELVLKPVGARDLLDAVARACAAPHPAQPQ